MSTKLRALLALIAVVMMSIGVVDTATASGGGNNGTIKIHEQGTPAGTESNDPKVCVFNIEGSGFDSGQTGHLMFNIQGGDQPVGEDAGPYAWGPADQNGRFDSQYFNLKPGHYKATLYGKMLPGGQLDDVKAKSKVFKVECAPPPDACPDLNGDQPMGTDCDQPASKVTYSEWADGDKSCESKIVAQTRTKTATPYKWDGSDWVLDTVNATSTTETQTRPMTSEELKKCEGTPPPDDSCPSLTGSIKTTLPDGSAVNGNIYTQKSDVYVYGSQLGNVTTVYIRVTDPSGSVVLSAVKQVTVTNGSFGPVQLPTFGDTPNNGGEYKVWVSTTSNFESKCTKFDNFKVKGEEPPPDYVVTATPNQGSCDVRTPVSTVTTNFASSIGYRLLGGVTLFVYTEVPAGTYGLTLPGLLPGGLVSYEVVVTPLDDSAEPIVKGPFGFTVPKDCDEVPPCTKFQDEDAAQPCYVTRGPDKRTETDKRSGCKLGGTETITTVYTTTWEFNETTQQWGSSEEGISSASFEPFTAAQQAACHKNPNIADDDDSDPLTFVPPNTGGGTWPSDFGPSDDATSATRGKLLMLLGGALLIAAWLAPRRRRAIA